MATKVNIPIALQKYAGGKSEIHLDGRNIRGLLKDLVHKTSVPKQKIYNEVGGIRRFINIYVNNEDIRTLRQEDTPIKGGDEVLIIFAIPGG